MPNAAVYLDFVLEVNDMKNCQCKRFRKEKCWEILENYVTAGCKRNLMIDNATRETVILAFRSNQFDLRIFDLAYEKAYQCLKFDFMPQFLISPTFLELEDETKVRRGGSTKIIDLKAILKEPKGCTALEGYLNETGHVLCLGYLRMWEDIDDFVSDFDELPKNERATRAIKILKVCQASLKLPAHLRAVTTENVNRGATQNDDGVADIESNCFSDLSNFLADILQKEVQRPFLVSKQYNDFLHSASVQFNTDSVIMTLSDFKDDRQLKETEDSYLSDLKATLKLENVLVDPLLSTYFRRFLRVSFQEENYLFFRDVQEMKVQYLVKSAAPDVDPAMTLEDILEVSATKIYKQYVEQGSEYQVDLSYTETEKIRNALASKDIHSGLFDRAQRSVFHQMRNGGFIEFKKHDLFNHFKKAHRNKFMQRYNIVGEKPLSEVNRHHKRRDLTLKHKLKRDATFSFEEALEEDKAFSFDKYRQQKNQLLNSQGRSEGRSSNDE